MNGWKYADIIVILVYIFSLCHCETQICKFACGQYVRQMFGTSEMVVSKGGETQLLQYDWCSLLDVVQWYLTIQ